MIRKLEFRNPRFNYIRKIGKKKRLIYGNVTWPIILKSHFNHKKTLGRRFKLVRVRVNRGRFYKNITHGTYYIKKNKKKLTKFFYKLPDNFIFFNSF